MKLSNILNNPKLLYIIGLISICIGIGMLKGIVYALLLFGTCMVILSIAASIEKP